LKAATVKEVLVKKKVFISIALILGIVFSNCATFKSKMVGKHDVEGGKNYGAVGVKVLFAFSHYRQIRGYDAIPRLDNKYQRISGFDDFFNDALNEFSNISQYATFTDFSSDVNEPGRRALKDSLMSTHDYVVKIKFMRQKSFSKYFLGAIASSLTLSLVPIPYRNSYSVDVEILNSQRQLIKTYSRKAALTKWVQTLLIFAYPFHPEKRKKEELYVEFLHDIFQQIETERVFVAK
jgi:hypothetical protein